MYNTNRIDRISVRNVCGLVQEYVLVMKISVMSDGDAQLSGDVKVPTQGKGVILRATDGATCYRVTVNNAGTLSTTTIPCW